MNWKAVPFKRRAHPAILSSAEPFSQAFHAGNTDLAAAIVFNCALTVLGSDGFMRALNHANWRYSLMKQRQKFKKGVL